MKWLALPAIAGILLIENLGAGPLNKLLLYLPGIDKVLHTAQSCIIFLVCHAVLKRVVRRPAWQIAVPAAITILFAVFDEVQQRFVGGRHVEARDVVAATGGMLLGLGWVVGSRHPRRAAALAVGALALSTTVTLDSYYKTRDYNRGLLLESQSRFRDARDAFRLSLAAGNRDPDLLNYLAWTEVESGDGDVTAAVGYAEESLAKRGDDPDTLDTYGWALHQAGRSAEALVPLKRALELKPSIYCIHYHLAITLIAAGHRDEGVQHLRLQVSNAPDTREAEWASALLKKLSAEGGTH